MGAALKREGGAGRSGEGSSYGIEESLEELGRLADTAGLKASAYRGGIVWLPFNLDHAVNTASL